MVRGRWMQELCLRAREICTTETEERNINNGKSKQSTRLGAFRVISVDFWFSV
jgi:hypothetical protein